MTNIWHPFTQEKNADKPINIKRAEGVWLYASDGRKILDGISSWWVNMHGHGHPHIAQAIGKQAKELEHVIFAGFTHEPAKQFCTKLSSLLPKGLDKMFFSDNGSTSVEVAIKLALQFHYNIGKPRTKAMAFYGAYHGDTVGAMSVGSPSPFNAPFQNHLFEVQHFPIPTSKNFITILHDFEEYIKKENPAFFIYEPLIQGTAGMVMYKADYLNSLLEICNKYQVITIADEVMTGFGRTGKMFASEYMKTSPDIMCLSKGITGGFMPLGLTVASREINQAFISDNPKHTFYHGHSYTANPIGCAAAIANLEVFQKENTLDRIREIEDRFSKFVLKHKNSHAIRDIRNLGDVVAIEFNVGEATSYFNSIRDDLYHLALGDNVLLRPLGNIIYAIPPYCIQDEELEILLAVMEKCIHYVEMKNPV